MNALTVGLHPDFPDAVWAVVEQPANEMYRLHYDPTTNTFARTSLLSLTHARSFNGAYGWVGGLGNPPERHCDLILVTERPLAAGAVVAARIGGIFYRGDGDHKVVALDVEASTARADDIFSLPAPTASTLFGLYSHLTDAEGWYGRDEACTYLRGWIATACSDTLDTGDRCVRAITCP